MLAIAKDLRNLASKNANMIPERSYFSQRQGDTASLKYDLPTFKQVFYKLYCKLRKDGYFQKYLGIECTDGYIPGKMGDVGLEVLLRLKKESLWEIDKKYGHYTEADLFDMIEFLYDHASSGLSGTYHSWSDCGTHYEKFDDVKGRKFYRDTINRILVDYEDGYELSEKGEVLRLLEVGFKSLIEAPVVADDKENINSRVDNAILRFRRAKSTLEDRKDAIRELADILEYLKADVLKYMDNQDAKDIFNIANNFGIRHHNERQKQNYPRAIWYSWMFYYYLATIQVVTRLKGAKG
jgi:hypothetical protein